MSNLPAVTGERAIRTFSKLGFSVVRANGSHHMMKREGHPHLLSVPVHSGRTLKTGTLRALIRAAGITPEQFVALMD